MREYARPNNALLQFPSKVASFELLSFTNFKEYIAFSIPENAIDLSFFVVLLIL